MLPGSTGLTANETCIPCRTLLARRCRTAGICRALHECGALLREWDLAGVPQRRLASLQSRGCHDLNDAWLCSGCLCLLARRANNGGGGTWPCCAPMAHPCDLHYPVVPPCATATVTPALHFPKGKVRCLPSRRTVPKHVSATRSPPPPPPCDIPSGCWFFTGPWAVTRSSLRMLRRGAAFCRPLRPVLMLVSFPHSRSPVVGVLGLC